MARDYKNRGRSSASAKSRTRAKSRPKKQGTPAPIWFLAGLSLGLGAAIAVHAYHVQLAPHILKPVAALIEAKPDEQAPASSNRPRFEFYKILPEMEVVVPAEEERALTSKSAPPAKQTPPATAATPASTDRYLLQVASFQQHAD